MRRTLLEFGHQAGDAEMAAGMAPAPQLKRGALCLYLISISAFGSAGRSTIQLRTNSFDRQPLPLQNVNSSFQRDL
jgi:hypothetical protein